MKQANKHVKGEMNVAESNGDINDGIGGHLDHVRCIKQRKIALDQKEEGNTIGVCTRSPK
jgi:hypothetical protein